MSYETCPPLNLKKKMLLGRNKIVRARQFGLLVAGQQEPGCWSGWLGGWVGVRRERCPTAPSPAAARRSHRRNSAAAQPQTVCEIINTELSVASKSATASSHPYHG